MSCPLHLSRRTAFTLIELLVVISIIAILIGILVPALSGGQVAARKAANQSQMRDIHQGLVSYSSENRGWYTGLDSTGSPMTKADFDAEGITTNDPPGVDPGVFVGPRAAQLVQNDYFAGETLISPGEKLDMDPWSRGDPFNTADVSDHMSYAMLAINPSAGWARNADWRNSTNPLAPVISDRNTGDDAGGKVSSIWTRTDSGKWDGHVAFNDGQVLLRNDPILDRTRYGSSDEVLDDNLFEDTNSTNSPDSDEAAMTYSGDGTAAGDFSNQGTP
jgi:prepilin-type N-terminal cleavage/methylation domain-containing protein